MIITFDEPLFPSADYAPAEITYESLPPKPTIFLPDLPDIKMMSQFTSLWSRN